MVSIVGNDTGFVTGNPPNTVTDTPVADPVLPFTFLVNPTWTIATPPQFGTVTIDEDTGEWVYTVDPDDFADLDDGELLDDFFVIRVRGLLAVPDEGIFPVTDTLRVDITIEGVCFTAGTLILTEGGDQRIETLSVGDKVMTVDRGLQPIRWVESSALPPERLRENPAMRPVRIKAGSLGTGQPERDLLVSQQHRILVRGPKVELLFGAHEALVAAKHLCSWPGISIDTSDDTVEYFHILLDNHEILTAEGAMAESLYLGEESLHTLSSDALQELAAIFPNTATPDGMGFGRAARLILREFEARALA